MKEVKYPQEFIDQVLPLKLKDMPKPQAIVGILNGGYVPATMVQRFYDVPLYWVQISSYGKGKVGKKLKWNGEIIDKNFIRNKKVLIVDDILDSGRTLKYVYHMLKAKSISAFVLVNKRPGIIMPCLVNYLSEIEPKVWVKFPWEE